MDCSVVIPCHNGAPLTQACIESLLRQDPGSVPTEILVVDNASRDETPQLGQLAPCVRVLRQERNLGFAGGVNAGLREARGELVMIVNNDTQAASNLLAEMGAVLNGHARMGAVGPISNHVKGPAHFAVGTRGKDAEGRAALQQELQARGPLQDVSTLAGLCLLTRRRTIDEIGLFDERFGHGNFEDDDFCLRLRLRGYRLGIAGRAFLHHEGHATFKQLGLDLTEELQRRLAQFTDKWRHDPAGSAYVQALAGDLETAARLAMDARSVYPQWPDGDWYLGRWHGQRGDHQRAIAHYRSLLRHSPRHVDGKLGLTQSLLRLGATDEAQAVMREILQDAPSPAQHGGLLRVIAGNAYQCGDYDTALATFTTALELTPQDGVLQQWIALCHMGAERFAEATQHFELAVEQGIESASINLAHCRQRLDDRRSPPGRPEPGGGSCRPLVTTSP